MNKLSHAIQTIIDVVHNKRGFKSTKEISQFRMKICEKCPFFDGKKCSSCGCLMSLKVNLASASCPENYWEQKEVEQAMFGRIDGEYIQHKCCGEG